MNNQTNYNLSEKLLLTAKEKTKGDLLFFQNQKLSPAEIKYQSEALAAGFRKRNIGVDDRILLVLYDSPTFVNVFLAIMAIGAIPVPVNPKIGEEALSYILTDSRAKAIVIESTECMRLKNILFQTQYIDLSDVIINNDESTNDHSCLSSVREEGIAENIKNPFTYYYKKSKSVAFWQYTSGTTGHPKAVQHSQEAMIYFSRLFAEDHLAIDNNDKIYSIPKMFFGYGLGNSLFYPMMLGAQVILDDSWPSLENVKKNLLHFRPTVFFCIPKMYIEILKHPEIFSADCFESVRLFFSAGSHLSSGLNTSWKEFSGKLIVDGIGSTELGHVYLCNKPDNIKLGYTGWPISGFEVKLDTSGWQNNLGELLVKPPFPMYGYWEDYERNCNKIKDGWYHSGDQFFYDKEDESYQYVGRVDDLFKVNGRWIIPSQIESAVTNHFPIDETALVCYTDKIGDAFPVLFYTGSELGNKIESDLAIFFSKNFDSYMLPKYYFGLNALPKNDNGKVMKRALVEFAFQNINETSYIKNVI